MEMTKALIQENNDKRELLTGDNKKMYEDFLVYLRTDLRIDEYQGEEILMEILNHLLEAQADGVDADEIFGNNPKGFADELIAELPSEKRAHGFYRGTIFEHCRIFTDHSGYAEFCTSLFYGNRPIRRSWKYGTSWYYDYHYRSHSYQSGIQTDPSIIVQRKPQESRKDSHAESRSLWNVRFWHHHGSSCICARVRPRNQCRVVGLHHRRFSCIRYWQIG